MNKNRGFTIVELLVVIVVIGILAAVTIVSYTGISQKAVVASLQSDLTGASKQFKIFQIDNSAYPSTISCSIGDSSTNKCLKTSQGNVYSEFTLNNSVNPQTFTLEIMNSTTCYIITESSPPEPANCHWIIGRPGTAMAGKYVYYQDELTQLAWKSTGGGCAPPQCSTNLDPNHMGNYSLVSDNGTNFSEYPARDACRIRGARLPYTNELNELGVAKSHYGNFRSAGAYWTATAFISSNPYFVQISNGTEGGSLSNGFAEYVRCIKDQP